MDGLALRLMALSHIGRAVADGSVKADIAAKAIASETFGLLLQQASSAAESSGNQSSPGDIDSQAFILARASLVMIEPTLELRLPTPMLKKQYAPSAAPASQISIKT